MKKTLLILLFSLFLYQLSYGQVNVFPDTARVGIGTANPRSRLEVNDWKPSLSISANKYTEVMDNNEAIASIDFYKHYAIAHSAAIKLLQAGGHGSYGQAHLAFYTSNEWNPFTSIPLEQMRITSTGEVLIGTTDSRGYKLAVNGNIRAKEIKVETANWPDYVFDQDYKVLGLNELDAYIKVHKHLPEMPSAKEAEVNGVELGEMNKLLLKKVEELTMHLIEKDKQITESKTELDVQKLKLSGIEKKYNQLSELVSKLVKAQNHE